MSRFLSWFRFLLDEVVCNVTVDLDVGPVNEPLLDELIDGFTGLSVGHVFA